MKGARRLSGRVFRRQVSRRQVSRRQVSRRQVSRSQALLVLVLISVAAAASVYGHARSHSFSSWRLDGTTARAAFWISEIEVDRLQGAPTGPEKVDWMGQKLAAGVSLSVDGMPCEMEPWMPVPAAQGFLRWTTRVECATDFTDGAELEVLVPTQEIDEHLHFAKLETAAESAESEVAHREEKVLSQDQPKATIGRGGSTGVFGRYLVLGVEHILIGLDHLAFIAALLLLCRRPSEVFWLITGFTVGHSLTLSLAVLDWVRPNIPVVEAFIGFTVALVAAEYLAGATGIHRRAALWSGAGFLIWAMAKMSGTWAGPSVATLVGLALFSCAYLLLAEDKERAARLRPGLTVCFGLVHGFGFAAVLMDLGLAPGRLAWSLLGFNLGVEIGQLLVVAVLVLAVRPLARRPERLALLLDGVALVLCGLGLYWLAERGFGLG